MTKKMDAIECIATRRSIRRFLDVPIDQETMLTIVEAGANAPSSGNTQDWRSVIIDDKILIKKVSDACLGQEAVFNAAFLVIICADSEQTERFYGLRGQRLYTIQNCAAAAQNMLLCAHALGLGGVWIGAFDESKLRSLIGIPANIRPQSVLCFGYSAEKPDNKILRELQHITFFNHYGSPVKNLHRFMKDYHVEWEHQLHHANAAYDRIKEKAIEFTEKNTEKMKEKSTPILKKYHEKIKEKIKQMKRKKN